MDICELEMRYAAYLAMGFPKTGSDIFGRYCAFFTYQRENHHAPPEEQGEISLVHCEHPDNLDTCEGNCTPSKCPLLAAIAAMEIG